MDLIWKLIGVMWLFRAHLFTWALGLVPKSTALLSPPGTFWHVCVSIAPVCLDPSCFVCVLQVESALHKDHVVGQWQVQQEEKKQVTLTGEY